MNTSKKKIIIIGGGAAGFFTAANLDENLYDVLILEQNSDVLQKIKISGGGRCNVTHACFDPRELVNFYPRGNKELLSVFTKFQPGDTMDWFETRGVALKIEDDNRVFPVSNSSQSIINALIREVNEKCFEVKTQANVHKLERQENQYLIHTKTEAFSADYVVFTPGSSPKAMKLIEGLGHHLVTAVPSLFTFNIKDELICDLPGTSFPYAEVEIPRLKTSESGPLLITHWGLSGPAILKLSAWEARKLADLGYQLEIRVNFIGVEPRDAEQVFKIFKTEHPKKKLGQSKIFEITNRFWNKVLEIHHINPEKQVANISSKEIDLILESLCQKTMQVTGKSTFKEEFVTAGGIDLKEINFKNMSSKVLPNFFIAGEILNIDAITGGFNFQACWSEGWLISQYLNTQF